MAVVRNKLSNMIKFSIHPLAAILKIKNPPGYRDVSHSPGLVMSATNISSVTQISPISDTQVRVGWSSVACGQSGPINYNYREFLLVC